MRICCTLKRQGDPRAHAAVDQLNSTDTALAEPWWAVVLLPREIPFCFNCADARAESTAESTDSTADSASEFPHSHTSCNRHRGHDNDYQFWPSVCKFFSNPILSRVSKFRFSCLKHLLREGVQSGYSIRYYVCATARMSESGWSRGVSRGLLCRNKPVLSLRA